MFYGWKAVALDRQVRAATHVCNRDVMLLEFEVVGAGLRIEAFLG